MFHSYVLKFGDAELSFLELQIPLRFRFTDSSEDLNFKEEMKRELEDFWRSFYATGLIN